jgi:hypothetical protein
MLSIIKLSKRPSMVVMVPLTTIQPIPARGMRPSKIESRSITGNNRPPKALADSSLQFPDSAAEAGPKPALYNSTVRA